MPRILGKGIQPKVRATLADDEARNAGRGSDISESNRYVCHLFVKDNPLLEKSLHFAARIVKLYQYLSKEKKESIISKQIIRSGTSIGANANEAAYGVSQADFIAKMQIVLKETAETEYWLKLLLLSDYLDEKLAQSLINDCLEIKRILIASLKTAKEPK